MTVQSIVPINTQLTGELGVCDSRRFLACMGKQLTQRVPLQTQGSEPTRSSYLILQLSQEEGQEVLDGVVFAQDGREAHDD